MISDSIMLHEYEDDRNTGMDVDAVAQEDRNQFIKDGRLDIQPEEDAGHSDDRIRG